jgi:ubiquinone/menaquinone biosynthesis C-methylase UbiE
MDDPSQPGAAFDAAYRELTLVNRYLGGVRAVRRFLGPSGGSLLDVASGASDIGAAVDREAGWSVTALDLNAQGLARARIARRVRGDAFQLPFAEGSFDVVAAALFFHHLSDAECAEVLRGMYRVARRRVIVNELHRTRAAYLATRALTRVFSRSAMVIHDAPLSVRRAFRPPELLALARSAGLGGRVFRSFPYRLLLVIDK